MQKKLKKQLRNVYQSMYQQLVRHFGHRSWWPAETPFEVCVGAILTQNTSWKNVERAIISLKDADALSPKRIFDLEPSALAALIRSAGYYNVKAKRLQNFVRHLVRKHGGNLDSLFSGSVANIRSELLSINGIGKETADSMILYAGGKPIFVVDAYTKRVLTRHRLTSELADYDALQDLFHKNLPRSASLFNDFHAQIVAVGNQYCRKTPRCDLCPLNGFPGTASCHDRNEGRDL